MAHNHSFAYKKVSTCSAFAKEGDDLVCTCTVKYYLDKDGQKRQEDQSNNQKAAAQAYSAQITTDAADATLNEIAAVK